ncbi:alpha-N-arabinofuranosidase [Catalinimonas alkaloidigena]|uniref:non-reducing end alpha-L-arabinofuranosidase n=1 Tax=Catalinimonas alkaloidigena TaxID=1075417 RepID=A0A1G9S744_9BACT|nr:alpha-L-arabinofuranosidase C-terminal domain-containing protein [Catalinimonas alkaloidigena]SDM31343.1 alpha-N-arabinofuranosidase [Catalinimonas alkaloidigena]
MNNHSRFLPVFLFSVSLLTPPLFAQNARIKIDTDRTIGEVSPLLYGNFVEHLGRCVYGGIYEPGSPLSDDQGFRKDVLAAVKELRPTIVRYPGGNFVSNYHWLDGVGPERTPRMELAWSRLETNQFGTNEFMDYTKMINTEPYFSVNMGTGTIEEAQHWVEYCNVKEGPYFAELRKKHGYPDPHNITYWSLGNEMDGFWQMGHLNAEDYSKKAREAAKLMKLTSPNIKLIAAGSSNYRPEADPNEWNATILHELRDVVDYIALHIYVGNPSDNYYNFLSTPLVMEQRTKLVKGMIDREMDRAQRGDRDPIYIAWDEYNVWYRARTDESMQGTRALEEHYNLEDALVIAGFLNGFVRNADVVKMANMAQLVNVIAPIFTNEQGMFKQTIFYPLALFANHVRGTSLDVFVDCDTYDTNEFFIGLGESTTTQTDVPYLDVSATYQDGEVVLCVMNRHKDKAITTDILSQQGNFSGNFEVYEVNGPDVKAQNDFGKETVKTVKKDNLKAKGQKMTYTFPAHSFTMIKGQLK